MTNPPLPPENPAPARTVGIGDRALVIDGVPTVLLSLPTNPLARDVVSEVAKAQRDGVNALQVSLGWQRDHPDAEYSLWPDFAALLNECQRQGMYVIVSHFTNAGKAGFADDLDQFAAFIAPLQWTAGGPVVAVWEVKQEQQEALQAALLRHGVTVPFIGRAEGGPFFGSESLCWQLLVQGSPYRIWQGEREAVTASLLLLPLTGLKQPARRRLAMWAQTFGEILLTGERRPVKTYGDLTATEVITREKGGVVFITNSDKDNPATGSVLPYLPDLTLPPQTTLPWVHDVPIGFGTNYLAAYGGLVKSDAFVLTVRVLPDPHQGIRVYVYGEPGETREVVVWSNHDKGRSTNVTFAADGTPQVYKVDGTDSQIVALSPLHAGQTFIHPTDDNAPVIIAARDVTAQSFEEADIVVQPIYNLQPGDSHLIYALRPDGGLTEILVPLPHLPPVPALSAWQMRPEPDFAAPDYDDADWPDVTGTPAPVRDDNPDGFCWYRARVTVDEATDATLQLPKRAGWLDLWVNGERAGASLPQPPSRPRRDIAHDIRLRAGVNTLCVLTTTGPDREFGPGLFAPATLVPSGGCYVVDVSQWKYSVGLLGERERWGQAGAAGFIPYDRKSLDTPVNWFRATFDLPVVPPAAGLVVSREGRGGLWVNGLRVSGDTVAGTDGEFFVRPDRLQAGENVIVLSQTDANALPETVRLRWFPREATITVAL